MVNLDESTAGVMSKVVVSLAMVCVAWCPSAHALPQYDPHDPIDLSFGVLDALESVERACICHDGNGEADRRRTVRLLCDLDWRRDDEGRYVGLGDWATKGVGGGERGLQFACAKLFRLTGELYGYPEYTEGYQKGHLEKIFNEGAEAGRKTSSLSTDNYRGGYGGSESIKCIPIEAETYVKGFKDGWYEKHPADGAYRAGYEAGKTANSATAPSVPSKYSAYSAKYKEGFSYGYRNGNTETKQAEKEALDAGYEKAGDEDLHVVPKQYWEYASKYAEGWETGRKAKKARSAGYSDAKGSNSITPSSIPSAYSEFADMYKEGFRKRYIEDNYYNPGHRAGSQATSDTPSSVPSQYSAYADEYKKGFHDGYWKKLRDEAYDAGARAGAISPTQKPSSIPPEYASVAAKYEEGFYRGFADAHRPRTRNEDRR
ncbi:MAG: hypothetical protein ILP07_08065 [Treponema sp.]|nr:hypothetical protein [Treponema sp.]